MDINESFAHLLAQTVTNHLDSQITDTSIANQLKLEVMRDNNLSVPEKIKQLSEIEEMMRAKEQTRLSDLFSLGKK